MRRGFWTLAIIVLSLLVAAGCGEFGSTDQPSATGSETTGGKGSTAISDKPFDAAEIKRAGCDEEVEEVENKGSEHVPDDVDYADNPPVSGDHNPVPLDWGVYTDEQPAEQWVHNLEHGHIVVLYKGISSKEYDQLRSHVKRDKHHINLIPRKANPKDGVYYLAWDNRLFCEKPSAPALQMMVEDYRDQGPELFMRDQEKQEEDDE